MCSGFRHWFFQILFLLAVSWATHADEEKIAQSSQQQVQQQQSQPLQWQFSVTVGQGKYGSMLFDEQASTLMVLPRWSLYYQRFYLENLDVGFNLLETEHFSVDLSGKQNFDALSVRYKSSEDALIKSIGFHDVKVVLNLQKRHLSYLAGVTTYFRSDDFELRSEWHTDISGVHHGHEWNTLFRYQYRLYAVDFASTFGIRRLDHHFANYYFGLSNNETSDLLLNQPGHLWLPSIKLDASYRVSNNLRFTASLKREWYPASVIESWFIGARQHEIWFMGLMYRW
jgi:MipA family protein